MSDQNIMDIRPIPVQQYKDASYEEAVAKGFDILQLKYDGWNARIEIHYGWVTWYSKTDRKYHQICYPDAELHAVLYGEHMFGTQWSGKAGREGLTYCFDLAIVNGNDLKDLSYRERYSLLRGLQNRLPEKFQVIPTYPIHRYAELWDANVKTGDFEGVVFRQKTAPLAGLILRHKATFTEDLQIVGFKQGQGKFATMLGSVQCVTKAGVPTDVGGGFDDIQRYEIWTNQSKYLGRWFEAEARARFDSGALRHGNFIRWRDDLTSA